MKITAYPAKTESARQGLDNDNDDDEENAVSDRPLVASLFYCCGCLLMRLRRTKWVEMGGMRMGFEPIGHYHHTSYHGRGRLGGSLSSRFGFAPG